MKEIELINDTWALCNAYGMSRHPLLERLRYLLIERQTRLIKHNNLQGKYA